MDILPQGMDPNEVMKLCKQCNQFRSSDRSAMKRHVAIVHGGDAFSTLQCRKCSGRFYDSDHFLEHLRASEVCKMVDETPLPNHLQFAFESLVDQMMIPIQNPPALIAHTDQLPPANHRETTVTKSDEIIDLSDDEEQLPGAGTVPGRSDPSIQVCTTDSGRPSARFKRIIEEKQGENVEIQEIECVKPVQVQPGRAEPRGQNGSGLPENRDRSSITAGSQGTGERPPIPASEPSSVRKQFPFLAKIFRQYPRGVGIKCKICSQRVKIDRIKGGARRIETREARYHVHKHLDLPLFKCMYCHQEKHFFRGMVSHIQWRHPYKPAGSNGIIDQTGHFEKEIEEMTRRCFDLEHQREDVLGESAKYSHRRDDFDQSHDGSKNPWTLGPSVSAPRSRLTNYHIDEISPKPPKSMKLGSVTGASSDELAEASQAATFGTKPFPCGECGVQFWNKLMAESHFEVMHGKSKPV